MTSCNNQNNGNIVTRHKGFPESFKLHLFPDYMRVEMVFLTPSQKKLEVLSTAICRALQRGCEGGPCTIMAQRVGFGTSPPHTHTHDPTGFQGHLSDSSVLTSGKRHEMPWIFLQTFHCACTTCLHSKLLDVLWGFPPLNELMGSLLPPALTAGHWRAFPPPLYIIHPRQGGSEACHGVYYIWRDGE